MKIAPMLQARGDSIAPPRVGHLVPLPGVVPAGQPDRLILRRFLDEMTVPLHAVGHLLDLLGDAPLPSDDQLAMAALRNHGEYLCRFLDEFQQYEQLEADTVVAEDSPVALRSWLDGVWQQQRDRVAAIGVQLTSSYRSFLPNEVRFDQALVARAVDAVLHVACQRTEADRIGVDVHFRQGAGEQRSQLVFELQTSGGGFLEIENGYVFVPMQVRDAARRPLLGLTIGQRLAQLLGGDLQVVSHGRARCDYRLAVGAEPAPGAVWIDPLDPGREVGPVAPRGQ